MRYLLIIMLFGKIFSQDEGLSNYNKKNYNNARLYYEKILKERKEDDAAKYGLGTSLYKLSDLEKARDLFGIVKNSKNKKLSSKAYYNLGNIYRDQDKLDESLSFYRKAIQLNPSDKEAKINYELLKEIIDSSNNNDQPKEQDSSENNNNDQSKEQDSSENNNQSKEQSSQREDESNQNKKNRQDGKAEDDQPQEQEKKDEEKQSLGDTVNYKDNISESNQKRDHKKPDKTDKQLQAEAILDALKGKEKINQKIKIKKSKSTKMVKDW